jgi:hypothetical protein
LHPRASTLVAVDVVEGPLKAVELPASLRQPPMNPQLLPVSSPPLAQPADSVLNSSNIQPARSSARMKQPGVFARAPVGKHSVPCTLPSISFLPQLALCFAFVLSL